MSKVSNYVKSCYVYEALQYELRRIISCLVCTVYLTVRPGHACISATMKLIGTTRRFCNFELPFEKFAENQFFTTWARELTREFAVFVVISLCVGNDVEEWPSHTA